MKENKPYPIIEEEDGSTLSAQEPLGAVAFTESYAPAEQQTIPGLPESWDELLDCLREGEEELERGEYIPWDVATNDLRKHIAQDVLFCASQYAGNCCIC